MNIYTKIITVIGLLALSVSSFAAPITPEIDPQLTAVPLTLEDVCSVMGGDAITFARMYKEGKGHEQVATYLDIRNDKEPAMVFAMPGALRTLSLIDNFRRTAPELYSKPNFPEAMGIVAHDMCTKDNARGWIQDVPGRAKIIRTPPGVSM